MGFALEPPLFFPLSDYIICFPATVEALITRTGKVALIRIIPVQFVSRKERGGAFTPCAIEEAEVGVVFRLVVAGGADFLAERGRHILFGGQGAEDVVGGANLIRGVRLDGTLFEGVFRGPCTFRREDIQP